MKKLFPVIIIACAVICTATTCKKENSEITATPSCIQASIDSALALPKGSLYTQVDAYTYQNATVYLFYSGCCDQFNPLRNTNCIYLFSPSGGITGGGDHTHPNFFNEAVKINTVWKDPRY